MLFERVLELRGYPFRRAVEDVQSLATLRSSEIEAWQRERAWEIAKLHAERNPIYRSLTGGRVPDRWEALPIVGKAEFQRPLSECLTQGVREGETHVSSTSGSSGQPFFFARDKYAHARSWAAIAEMYGWHGIRLASRQARFYGVPLRGWSRVQEASKDVLMNRARFPVFDLSDAALEVFRRRLSRGRFDYIYGYTNSLLAFAGYLQRSGRVLRTDAPKLKTCVVTSEMCTPTDRRRLGEAFGIPVVIEYGASEVGVIAFEDDALRWRLAWKNLLVEVVDEAGQPAPPGASGSLLLTDLFNRAMPFVRYRVGDVGSVRAPDETPTGEPELGSLEGRTNDTILLPSGRRAAGMTFYYVSRSLLEQSGVLREFVVRQTALDELAFDVVSDGPLSADDVAMIEGTVKDYLEPGLRLRIRRVDAIPRTSSGKRQHFFSELSNGGGG